MVKIHKTAICGTDVHIYNWDKWSQQTIPVPMTIGHEFVGEIIELGQGVVDLHVGDIVSGEGHIVCGKCRNCLAGKKHLCKDTQGVGVNRTGIFSEYAALPASNIWVPHGNIPEDIISIFVPLGNAAHTALSFDLLGEDVLITGAGPIGAMAAAIARHAGARFIVVSDVNPYRLELAKKLGADRVVDVSKEKLSDVMLELDMIDLMVYGGKIAMLGIQSEDTVIDWNKIVFNGIHIKDMEGKCTRHGTR